MTGPPVQTALAVVPEVLSVVLVLAGCVFYAAGTTGMLRFPDVASRLHALTKADNLGLGLVLLGLAVRSDPAVAAKLVLIWALALLSATTTAQLLAARAAGLVRSTAGPGHAAGSHDGQDGSR